MCCFVYAWEYLYMMCFVCFVCVRVAYPRCCIPGAFDAVDLAW